MRIAPTTARARTGALLAVAALVAACGYGGMGGPAASDPAWSTAPATAAPAATSPTPVPSAGAPVASPAASAPAGGSLAGVAWAGVELVDVTTGASFTIAGLAGTTVFVEPMATWCSNCRLQQARFADALARLPAGSVEYVVISVDPNEDPAALAAYRAGAGFPGRYAVAGRELLGLLEAAFGPGVLSPPSVPLIRVDPTGVVSFTVGAKSADDIVDLVDGA